MTERAAVSLVLLAWVAVLCAGAMMLSPRTALLPLAAGLPTLVLCAIQAARDLRRPDGHRQETGGHRPVLSLAALLAGMYVMGLGIALPIFAGVSWKRAGSTWRRAVVVAAVVALVVHAAFEWLLTVAPYRGVLGRALRLPW